MEFAFVFTGKEAVSMESVKYFPYMGFVLRYGYVVGVDQNVIQVNDDNDIDHICEDVIHESLKS